MTCAPAYGLGTSKKKKKKPYADYDLRPRPMAWAQVTKNKKTLRRLWLVPSAYGLGTSKKTPYADYDLCPRPMAWAQEIIILSPTFAWLLLTIPRLFVGSRALRSTIRRRGIGASADALLLSSSACHTTLAPLSIVTPSAIDNRWKKCVLVN